MGSRISLRTTVKRILITTLALFSRLYMKLELTRIEKACTQDGIALETGDFSPILHPMLQEYIRRHTHLPDTQDIFDMLVGILREKNEIDLAYTMMQKSLSKRLSILSTYDDPTFQSKVVGTSQGKVVFLSGYYYSGSGAVLDYLEGFDGTIKWGPKSELRIIKFPGGLADLLNRLRKKGSLELQDILDLYLHIVGTFHIQEPPGTYSMQRMVNTASQIIVHDAKAQGYLHELLVLFQQINELMGIEGIEKQYITLCRAGLQRAFNAIMISNHKRILLVDQGITAWRLPYAELVVPAQFIIVHRDPRDQLVDANAAKVKHGGREWTAEEFCKLYMQRRKLVAQWVPILEAQYGHRCLLVSFEHFVTDHDEESKRIREFLDLNHMKTGNKQLKFDPTVSIKNIGKYCSILSKEDIALIEQSCIENIKSLL